MSRNICVVGAGYWGKNHIRTLNNLGFLGGIVEPNKYLLNKFSKEYPEAKVFENLDLAIKDKSFRGFTIATPANTHFRIASKIIRSSKNVLVEKPLCLNINEAKKLVELSKQYKINLMVGHVLLFHPAIQEIKKTILDGKIGKLQYLYSNRLNLGQVRTEENVFWSLAPHDISIFQFLTDSYPESIIANGSTFLQKNIHDSTITYLKYPNKVEGHIFVSWLHPFKEHRLVVIGSEGMLVFEDSAEKKPIKLYSKKIDIKFGIPEKIDGPVKLINYERKMPLTEELKYSCENLDRENTKTADGKSALEVVKILIKASKQLEKK